MSNNTFQEYIQFYQQLSHPQHSKKANLKLLQIQQSNEAWTIAYQLISMQNNPDLVLHGEQLLSKKLNVPPPSQIDISAFMNYLYQLPQKTSLTWLCIAKIMVHMSPKQPFLPQELAVTDRFKLLKEIPAAITHIRTKIQMDGSQMKEGYISLAIPLIIKEINSNTDAVIQCLDSFVSYGTKVRNSQLIKVLMSLPFEVAGHILEQILGRESYPQLQNDIVFYLDQNKNKQKICQLYVTYFKYINLTNISFEQLRSALQFILHSLVTEGSQPRSKLSESFELWNHMANQYKAKGLPEYVKQTIKDALLTVWRITCKEALLAQLPDKVQSISDPLDLDLDLGSNSEQDDSHYEANKDLEYFREYAGDFFMLCYETLSGQPSALELMNSMINDLVMGQLVHLQLSIRIICSLASAKNNVLVHAAPAIARIFGRSSEMNEYICREVIRMIGQLGEVLACAPELLAPALQFLSNSFLFPSLAVVASSSCNNLLQEMDLSKASGLLEMMQTFMEHVYQVIFKVDCEQKVIENLSKSMAIFVYKVKYSPEAYATYLNAFAERISKQAKENQPKFIESAIAAQLWVNSREEIAKNQAQQNSSLYNDFMPPFATFLQNLVSLMLELLNVSEKRLFFRRMLLISTALRTDCIGNGQIWVQLCDYLLQHYLKQVSTNQVGKIIAPIINLTRAAYELKTSEVAATVAKCLKKWHQEITSMLDLTLHRIDLTMSSSIIYFHVRMAQLIKLFPQTAEMIGYTPEQLVKYLIWVLSNKQAWEYQLFKYALQYFLLVLQLGYPPAHILACILSNFDHLQQFLWTSLDPVLNFIFKSYGLDIYDKILLEMKSPLGDKNNPLNTVLREGFQKGESKTVKNLLLSL